MAYTLTPELQKLHNECIIMDAHCDTLLGIHSGLLNLGERYQPPADPCKALQHPGHVDIPRMLQGGMTTQSFACFIREQYLPAQATHEALHLIDLFYQALEQNPATFMQVTCAADVEKAKREGKTGGMLTLEGVESLEGDLGILRMFYRLGVRQAGITWNWRNQAADGLYETRSNGGLTEFGVKLVKECNRLGVILDIAHLAPAGIKDILKLSEQPIIDSHCGARSVTDHVRNLSDEQLDGMAANGGLVCVTYVPPFINADENKASIEDVLNHIDYIAHRIGVDHVGLGSDFDGYENQLPGLTDVSEMAQVTAGLAARGYKPEDIKKVMGGNYLRLIRQVVG